ncbi:hypothetical protein SLEP1_g51710 [Rubroshorea leprosula]|uniref:Uncharacterized protein n=1 Tax=Rubroshorea leprosula TaxID=152421 RepID=A0AAV5M4T7_9ROSI|nr:hypothetical protein SLEP1_g51710 [Rubroshorea leprosula]
MIIQQLHDQRVVLVNQVNFLCYKHPQTLTFGVLFFFQNILEPLECDIYFIATSKICQDSFYHNLSEEELARVHEYNFDHPGEKHFYNLDTDFQGNWKHIFIFLLLAFALC